jgi:hypothetical protein
MPDVSTEKDSVSIRRLLSAHTRRRNGGRNGRIITGDAACKAPRHYVGTRHDQLSRAPLRLGHHRLLAWQSHAGAVLGPSFCFIPRFRRRT